MNRPRRFSKPVVRKSAEGDECEALEEVAEILSEPDVFAALEEGLAEIKRGETITLSELRSELAALRSGS